MDLQKLAIEKFGADRAEELRQDIQLVAEDLEKLRTVEIGLDDEP
jgi:hypothetical protein